MELCFGFSSGNNTIVLSAEESNHLINVKRFRSGELVQVTDGKGNLFTARLTGVEKKQCILSIEETEITAPKIFQLHVAIAPTKNIDRIEWFLEKAIETGIEKVSFIRCRHSERKEVNEERLLRIAVSAMKQSKKIYLPEINGMTDFGVFIKQQFEGNKLIFSMSADGDATLKRKYEAGNNLTALIGPEGDFHTDELNLARECGFVPTTLGKERLRTETAGLAVCTLFNFINSQ